MKAVKMILRTVLELIILAVILFLFGYLFTLHFGRFWLIAYVLFVIYVFIFYVDMEF